jgi:lactate dehydrogenase-like 2-hydroxyacid dehydrogenase
MVVVLVGNDVARIIGLGRIGRAIISLFFYKVNPGQCKVPYIGHG